MFGNKNSYSMVARLVLLVCLIMAPQAKAVDTQAYFSVTKFNLSDKAPKESAVENSPLNSDLIYRVAFGRAEDVKILLQQGANPDARNPARIPVLHVAVIRKDDEAPAVVKALLDGGANVNLAAPDGNVPVVTVVKSGRPDILQILIDHKAVLTYARDADGKDLKTLAENRADPEIISILNAGLDREKDQIASLKSEDNFINLVQEYSFLNCANEYLKFYISTEPEGVDMVEYNRVMVGNDEEIANTEKKIKSIFKMGNKELAQIKYNARGEIVQRLKYYQTNANRELNGVGTDEDLNKRCEKIASKWNAKRLNRGQLNQNIK